MILLIGAGPMAVHYANVLKGLKKEFRVVGRSLQSAETFEKATGVTPSVGGLESFLKGCDEVIEHAIVAVSVEQLEEATRQLLMHGVTRILVEKPGGLTLASIHSLQALATERNANVFIAYNRRFLSSVLLAKDMIADDGGVTSFIFELTEWSDSIAKIHKAEGVKENWFFANTSHVTDLAFYLGGLPEELSCYVAGKLDWHSRASRFFGAGKTNCGALFSYSGDWDAPGRWAVEVMTSKRRYIFKPMEKLQVQNRNSVAVDYCEVDDSLDQQYKPGLFLQVKHFLDEDFSAMCSLQEHLASSTMYARIANYDC
ncbi:Gfo/Idh/MocA family oxidoreductase [Pseudomonas sp. H9]|uniref:Gfo/Idh/MocA family oxidoreductase n=1 Tax=Pseudomonas sp. H9 TaxID=483968 RepID=UPI0010580030|nr:Gfo/Idh/MocA family oxidoreductase [Pseudomonas sp. H9]TDF81196.1 Gfo/Idh/MocA family oxidoreductase [Pseudomonas sp. H9]